MSNRLSALWLIAGAISGYVIAGSSAAAQNAVIASPPVLNPGTTVQLVFERGALAETNLQLTCTVEDVQTPWIKCKPVSSSSGDRAEQWYNLKHVTGISRR